ncbi:MAG: DUF4190 domain-containing protein [Phycisphaerae bacterium]|jgi:hypothetical protein|nr:DUF4190 domain-containing protein [Phycisphaerae bacterium]|tara:strand:- start:257 stop:913 length:657 start_codon:yes stop_codon:yes gene_type:complete
MQKKRLNAWSMVSALCAIGLCPLFSIAAIFAGFRALVEIKARGDTRGVRLAWASILVGATITGLWGGGMLWWNINVRSMIEQGPVHAIVDGQSGSVESFLDIFSSSSTPDEATAFLHSLHTQYGTLQSGHLDEDIAESPVDGSNLFLGMVPIEAELSYVLLFENKKMVKMTAQYDLFLPVEGGNKFTNRFAWLRIQTEEDGVLVYPAQLVEDMVQHGE